MEYRRIAPLMGNLWSPIAAVTSSWEGKSNVQIAVAISAASIVPEKPRVLLQVYKTNHSHDMIQRGGAFALNFLRPDQLDLITRFGFVSGRDQDKLAGTAFAPGPSGSPILEDCWGYLDCRVINVMDGGDMTCFLGQVVDGETRAEGDPLWWREARRRLPASWMEEWDRKISEEIQVSLATMDLIDRKN
jgi:flavin reductase (DIM6/NTAB) family NADH-FMN oxidoreductase RutF